MTDKPQKPLKAYIDAIEQAAPEDKAALSAELLEAMDPTGQSIEKMAEMLKEAAKGVVRIQPFIDAIFKAYPDGSEWYMHQPLSVIISPIGVYMQDRGLEDGKDIESHRAGFLAFFRAYIDELEAAYEKDNDLDMEAAQEAIFKGMAAAGLLEEYKASEITRTIYPLTLIAPIDKVSKKAFAGELTEQLQPLAMERRTSNKQVTTLASINFSAPQLQGLKGLTMYDRSVYNAICTLYIRGGNEYITPQMIYQVMTGKEEAYLNPKQAAEISSSITKFMYGGIRIDATDEVNKHHISGSLVYDTNLLHAERVKRNLNGTIAECIRIIKTPVLYEYASSKDQIGSAPIAALATPINKNSDTLALQAYLLERIFAMRGTDPQRDIAYSSIYSAIWGKESSSTKGPQSGYSRLKKSRLRESAVKMLEYWTTAGTAKDGGSLIKGFGEYKRGKTKAGVTISL